MEFASADAGKPKAEVAAARLRALVPEAPVELFPLRRRFDQDSAGGLLEGAALLLDGTDSFATRFLANDRALAAGVPLVHGAVLEWTGQLLSVPPGGPCLRCLFEAPPAPGTVPACAEAGVASPLCGLVGAAMAAEALRLLAGERPRRGLLRWEGLAGRTRTIPVPRDLGCPACASPLATEAGLRHQ